MRVLHTCGVSVCLGLLWCLGSVCGAPVTFKWCSQTQPELNCSVYAPFSHKLLEQLFYYYPVYGAVGYPFRLPNPYFSGGVAAVLKAIIDLSYANLTMELGHQINVGEKNETYAHAAALMFASIAAMPHFTLGPHPVKRVTVLHQVNGSSHCYGVRLEVADHFCNKTQLEVNCINDYLHTCQVPLCPHSNLLCVPTHVRCNPWFARTNFFDMYLRSLALSGKQQYHRYIDYHAHLSFAAPLTCLILTIYVTFTLMARVRITG
uniref:Glycoprotein 4 n=1 Tax=Wobbly possum disease virus TaxID=1118369 RepID=A0A6M3QIS3_9NIDO|nr:glycoprotein 4 [Wobbly possum disease virus]QJC19028.1 glycoprotein 4 [Wobbly possum disease virus]